MGFIDHPSYVDASRLGKASKEILTASNVRYAGYLPHEYREKIKKARL
jgi:hypothetical protein